MATKKKRIPTISVVGGDVLHALPRLGRPGRDVAPPVLEVIAVDADVMARQLQEFIATIQPVLDEQQHPVGRFQLDEVELRLSFDVKTGFRLIGSAEAGLEAGISIKLKRRQSQNDTQAIPS